jgi:hypothetical protein
MKEIRIGTVEVRTDVTPEMPTGTVAAGWSLQLLNMTRPQPIICLCKLYRRIV